MDFRQLFKLRLVVAALGETQRLGWWNSGVLTGTGEFLFQQGFPRSSPFAQTRAGFRLTPQLEDAFENERNRWMDEPQGWVGGFEGPLKLKSCQWQRVHERGMKMT